MHEAVEFSLGFVGSEIEAAIKEAIIHSFDTGEELTGTLISDQLREMKPLSEAFAEDFNAIREWAESNARMASLKESKPKQVRSRRKRNMGGNK